MEAKTWENTVMEQGQLKDIVLKAYCSPETTRKDITINNWCYDMVEAQAEITWNAKETEIDEIIRRAAYELSDKHTREVAEAHKAGIREVVEWIKKRSQLERCDPDVMAYFNEYRWVDEIEWQAKLKDWNVRNGG